MSNTLSVTGAEARAEATAELFEAKRAAQETVLQDYEAGKIEDADQVVDYILDSTKDIADLEHQIGVIEALRKYPKAMFWSCIFAVGVVMAGYDAQIITSFYALPSFVDKYGQYSNGEKQVTAAWQTGLGMGNPIGQILGSLAVSWPSERYGRKLTGISCVLLLAGIVFIQFFAPSVQVLTVGEVLAGLMWGAFITLCPTYASEVAPLPLRGILTGFINMAFVVGQFVSQGVVAGCDKRTDQWGYRIPFALQWMWCLVLLLCFPFAPESPWYLIRRGRKDEARESLKALQWDRGMELEQAVYLIEQTDLLERELETKSSYWDCFKKANLVRTEICIVVYSTQVLAGNPLIGYATYFFTLAGLNTDESFNMGVGINAVGFVATLLCFFVISYCGRRRLYNYGMACMTVLLFIIAILDCPSDYENNRGLSWAQASLLIIWTFIYQLTIGPLTFIIISEISSTKLRSRTIGAATAVQALCSIVMTVAVPYMFNPENANMRGKIAFFFGALSAICLVWAIFRLPETKGRTFQEIDIMFERKVKLSNFRHYDVFGSQSATNHEEKEKLES